MQIVTDKPKADRLLALNSFPIMPEHIWSKDSPKLAGYTLQSVSAGQDAQGEVSVRVEHKGMIVSGKGTSTDIVEASAKAYLSALNKLSRRPGPKAAKKIRGGL